MRRVLLILSVVGVVGSSLVPAPIGLCIGMLSLLALVILDGSNQRLMDRHHRLAAKGLCVHCGYDLRGSPEKCPECGMVPRAQ